jgi:hypothetical protein
MPKFEIAKLKIDLSRLDLNSVEVPKPVYAGAGVAGLAVETVKGAVGTLSKKLTGYRGDVSARVAGYQKQVAGFEPKAFADSIQSRTTAGVGTLAAQAKARRAAVESGVSGLQAEAKTLPGLVTSFYKETSSEALGAYEDLAKRGEVLVARLRGEAPTEVAVSVTSKIPAAPAKKATAKKAPAKAAPAKKAAAKKAPAKKASAKKTPAKKAPASTSAETPAATPAATPADMPAKAATPQAAPARPAAQDNPKTDA